MSTPRDVKSVIALAERKTKKINAFIAMLKDPDLADIVTSLTSINNGNGSATSASAIHKKEVQQGSMRDAIRGLYGTLPDQFTSALILNALEHVKFPFPREGAVAIRDALYKMTKSGELKVVKEGKGGQPNIYSRAPQSRQSP